MKLLLFIIFGPGLFGSAMGGMAVYLVQEDAAYLLPQLGLILIAALVWVIGADRMRGAK